MSGVKRPLGPIVGRDRAGPIGANRKLDERPRVESDEMGTSPQNAA
jgi:hypothetical protein